MDTPLQKWQRSLIRNGLDQFRKAVEEHFIKNKRFVELPGGLKAYSLLSPPLGSAAARRRLRLVMNNVTSPMTQVDERGAIAWGRRTPHFVTVAVTYRCQCDCAHCSASCYRQRVEQEQSGLSLGELTDCVQRAVELGCTCVVLTGGEPLLLSGIEELIASLDPSEATCIMFTNGEYLTAARVAQLRAAGLFGVFVSFDFPDAAAHDANRQRPGLFQAAVAGIRRCQEAGLLTGIATFVTSEKLRNGQLEQIIELGKELDVLEVFLFDAIPTGRLTGQPECLLSDADAELIGRLWNAYNDRPDYPRIVHQTMLSRAAHPCAAEGCPAGMSHLHLRANGDVTPCDFAPFSFGNIRQRPLGEIWRDLSNHPVYSKPAHRCRLANPDYWQCLTECGLSTEAER